MDMGMVSRRKVVLTDEKVGELCARADHFRLLVEHGQEASYQLPENAGILSDPQNLPARSEKGPSKS